MIARIALFAALAAACSFERASLGPGEGAPDAAPRPDADPGAPDAPPVPPDATPGTPDASAPDACVPIAELCNGMDDDCDGDADEGLGVGMPCDGDDTDQCNEGLLSCNGSGAVVCTDMTGSTVEVCNGLDDDCDSVPDDGFDFLGDEANCGGCGNTCTNVFGSNTCLAGNCSPTCDDGALDCNANPDDGCEPRNSNPMCAATVTTLGSINGDSASTPLTISGFGEAFYLINIAETNTADFENLTARIELDNPAGVDFDIHLRCLACGGTFVDSTTAPAGVTDSILVGRTDVSGFTDYSILVEVRMYEADACGNWTLTVTGDDPTTDTSCD